jgi:hypothetical protein
MEHDVLFFLETLIMFVLLPDFVVSDYGIHCRS